MSIIRQTEGFDDPKSALRAVGRFRIEHGADLYATVSITSVTVTTTKGANKGESHQRFIVHSKWLHDAGRQDPALA